MKNLIWSFAVFSALSLPLVAPAETVSGSAVFTDTSGVNNGYSFTGVFDHPTFNFSGGDGFVYTDNLTITAVDVDCHRNCNADADNIAVTLTFTLPNSATASFAGTGDVTFHGLWNGSTIDWSGNSRTITFSDGWSLLITLEDFTFTDLAWEPLSGTDNVTMKLSGPAAPTPEPSSLALLGTGILGTAGMLRRKLSA
jgi:hypothetical protein